MGSSIIFPTGKMVERGAAKRPTSYALFAYEGRPRARWHVKRGERPGDVFHALLPKEV